MKNYKLTIKLMSLAMAVTLLAGICFATGITGTAPSALADGASDTAPVYVSPAVAVYEKCADSVVGVVTYVENWSRSTGKVEKTRYSEGSGVILTEDGYILTNNHVIANGTYYEVLLSGNEAVEAALVGTDSGTDLAVLKVDRTGLKPIEIGSSSELKVGQTVIAVGNPGGSVLANSVTQGIVSALERDVGKSFKRTVKTIQHDAAINPGNSGGALLNAYGQLIGINTLKMSGSAYTARYEGLGFAIPIDLAYPLAQQIIAHGEVFRPALGINCMTFEGPEEVTSSYPPASVLINSISEGTPAEQAGLQALDFITQIDDVRISSLNDLTSALEKYSAGDTVSVKVIRYDDLNSLRQLLSYQGYIDSSDNYGFGYPFGFGFGYGYGYGSRGTNFSYQEYTIDVTLELLGSTTNKPVSD